MADVDPTTHTLDVPGTRVYYEIRGSGPLLLLLIPLLGDPTPVQLRLGFPMPGRQPSPRAQLLRTGKAGHVADLGDEHRANIGPTPPTACMA
jgi:hypothetical protein